MDAVLAVWGRRRRRRRPNRGQLASIMFLVGVAVWGFSSGSEITKPGKRPTNYSY